MLSLLFYSQILRKATITLDLKTDAKTTLKIYWRTGDQPYSEDNMSRTNLSPGVEHYSLSICDIGKVDKVRIDTSDERVAKVTLVKVAINQSGYAPIVFDDVASLAKLAVLRGIKSLTNDGKGLVVVPADTDPQLEYPLTNLVYSPEYIANTLRIAGIFFMVGLCFVLTQVFWEDHSYVPYLLVFVLALIVVMASVSKYNDHPDEFVHIYAAEYYQNHTLPPEVGSPDILHTYSPYGVSRLDSGEIAYFVAGKFLKLFEPFCLPSYLVLRFFNIMLFASLFFIALHRPPFRILLLPIFLSSQIWYMFSYFNSEAFVLFLTLIAAYQVVIDGSMFNILLRERLREKNVLSFLCIAGLFALLLLSKLNFYIYIVFLFLYLVWKIMFKELALSKTIVMRFLVVAATGFVLAGCFRAGDIYVNGFCLCPQCLSMFQKGRGFIEYPGGSGGR